MSFVTTKSTVGLLAALVLIIAVSKNSSHTSEVVLALRVIPKPDLPVPTATELEERKRAATERAKRTALRKQLGAESCRKNGVGPTGGFCLSANEKKVGGNHVLAKPLATELFDTLFSSASVLDLGAGLGQYEELWEALHAQGRPGGPNLPVRAFDGAENIEEVTGGKVSWSDFTEPLEDVEPADWVMSLEVGD